MGNFSEEVFKWEYDLDFLTVMKYIYSNWNIFIFIALMASEGFFHTLTNLDDSPYSEYLWILGKGENLFMLFFLLDETNFNPC